MLQAVPSPTATPSPNATTIMRAEQALDPATWAAPDPTAWNPVPQPPSAAAVCLNNGGADAGLGMHACY